MNKIIFAGLIASLFLSYSTAFAENEALYSGNTGTLSIPIVSVGADRYAVEMQRGQDLNFTVSSLVPLQTIVGRWVT